MEVFLERYKCEFGYATVRQLDKGSYHFFDVLRILASSILSICTQIKKQFVASFALNAHTV